MSCGAGRGATRTRRTRRARSLGTPARRFRHLSPAAPERILMTRVLHRTIGHDYPVAVSGDGIFIRDASGKEYIDASSGAAVSCLGHSNAEVRAAMHAQLDKL